MEPLHHQKRLIVGGDTEIEDPDYSWVVNCRKSPGFSLEPLDRIGVHGQVAGQHFDCHLSLQNQVDSGIDLPHPPCTQELPELETIGDNIDHRGCLEETQGLEVGHRLFE